MTRIAFTIGLAAALTVSSGELQVFSEATRGEHGSEDGSHGHHSHHGEEGVCHPHIHLPASMLAVEDSRTIESSSVRFPRRQQETPPPPAPGDISHVPKAQLA